MIRNDVVASGCELMFVFTLFEMSRELRRRVVDWNKSMSVIKSESELLALGRGDEQSEEDGGATSPPPSSARKQKKAPPKEIVVPAAAPVAVDLGELGLDPGNFARPKLVRWRSSGIAADPATLNTAKDDDPLGSEVHYHMLMKDEEILKEVNASKSNVSRDDLRKLFDTWEKGTGTSRTLIDHARAIELAHQRGMLELPAHVLNEVYAAWCRRREENKRPLLRMFWPVGVTGDEPPTSGMSTFRISSSRLRLRRQRRNYEQLLHRARELHKDALSQLTFCNNLYIGERLKRQKTLSDMCINSLQAKRKDYSLYLHELKQDISSFKEEQKNIHSKEEVLGRTGQVSAGGMGSRAGGIGSKRKVVYVEEGEVSGGGGMLGGLAKGRKSVLEEESKNRLRMRLRVGRSGLLYVDRVGEGKNAPSLRFLPQFAQFDSFGSWENSAIGNEETKAHEYGELFIDEIYENIKSVRAVCGGPEVRADEAGKELAAALAAYRKNKSDALHSKMLGSSRAAGHGSAL